MSLWPCPECEYHPDEDPTYRPADGQPFMLDVEIRHGNESDTLRCPHCHAVLESDDPRHGGDQR